MKRLASSLLLAAGLACATTVQTFTLNPSNVPVPPATIAQTQVAITPEDGLGHTYLVMVVLPSGQWLVQVASIDGGGSVSVFFATIGGMVWVWEIR